jgi:uncharacterized protein (DUF169 family)
MSLTIGGTPAHELVEWAIKNGKATRPLRVLPPEEIQRQKRRQLEALQVCHFCRRSMRRESQSWKMQCAFRATGLTHEPEVEKEGESQ